jgi:hypothetical protein
MTHVIFFSPLIEPALPLLFFPRPHYRITVLTGSAMERNREGEQDSKRQERGKPAAARGGTVF